MRFGRAYADLHKCKRVALIVAAVFLVQLTPDAFEGNVYAQSQSESVEMELWRSVRDSHDVDELKAYLESYPNGTYAALARLRIEKLKGIATQKPYQPSVPSKSKSPTEPLARASLPQDIPALTKRLEASVVHIRVAVASDADPQSLPPPSSGAGGSEEFETLFKEFFKNTPNTSASAVLNDKTKAVTGTGFVIDPTGWLLTAYQIVRAGGPITVILHDGRQVTNARPVWSEETSDIAILKIDPPAPLKAVALASPNTVAVGDWGVLMGNPFGIGLTVNAGIVSDVKPDRIHTDITFNRGSAGGPIFGLNGHVIGMASSVFSVSGGNLGIGVAVRSDVIRKGLRNAQHFR